MATSKRKIYGNMRIMAIEGKDVLIGKTATAKKNGKLNPDAFGGIMDESLDTDALAEIYGKHESKIGYPYLEDEKYCRALVNVSFNYAVKLYEQQENRFIRYGYTVTDADMKDHVCVKTVNGAPLLVAIEIAYNNDEGYVSVKKPIDEAVLGKYFSYDTEKKVYKRSKTAIPSSVKCEEIRELLYTDGFDVDGVHYVRYKRSAGASRSGKCLFIAEPLYTDMIKWSSCGLGEENVSDQASWQAYIALTLSSIEGVIRLPKKAILIIPDKVSRFKTVAVCVKKDDKEGLVASEEETEIENVIWDGEALLDVSEFENIGYREKGMMLLRNRFFKTCAFNTNLQKWFADNGIAEIRQLAGYTTARKISDIKLVITESSLKYLKFMPKSMGLGDAFKAWLDAAYEGRKTSAFGIVKTDKSSHAMFGKMAYTNYQLLNTLNVNRKQMEEALEQSIDFYKKMLSDPTYLRYYINMTSKHAEIEDYEVLRLDTYRRDVILDMTVRTPLFQYTDFYKNFRSDTLKHYKRRLKKGRIAVTGNYQTIFGNPYEFLTAVIDKRYEPTEPLLLKNNEVHSKRFPHNQVMLGARSPHITMGNLFAVRNVLQPEISEYFNLTENIICVNAIGDNIQQRLNGCDYDSDSMLVTNNPGFIQHGLADIYYSLGVPVCQVAPSGKTDYKNNPKDIARLDKIIGNNKIGDIVNLSQFLNSLHWHLYFNADHSSPRKIDRLRQELYSIYDDICKLAVMSGMEIDKAKRLYSVDATKVLRSLSKRKNDFKKKNGGKLPDFYNFMIGNEDAIHGDDEVKLDCPMSFIYDIVNGISDRAKSHKTVKLSELFSIDENDCGDNDTRRKQSIIETAKAAHEKITLLQTRAKNAEDDEKKLLIEKAEQIFAECISAVSKNLVNDHIIAMLLKEIDNPKESRYNISSCRHLLFACMLYENNRRLLSRVIIPDDYYPMDLEFINIPTEEEYRLKDAIQLFDYPHQMKNAKIETE